MSPTARILATSLSCAVLAAGCVHHRPWPPAPPPAIRYSVAGWLLEARTDPFTQVTRCRIANRLGGGSDATATPAAFTFRFARRMDTSDAWYRIDAGPPHPWRDLSAELIDAGAMGDAERLDNPSGGMVLVPTSELSHAQAITIRPAQRAVPRRFDLRGAWPLLAAAATLNCRF